MIGEKRSVYVSAKQRPLPKATCPPCRQAEKMRRKVSKGLPAEHPRHRGEAILWVSMSDGFDPANATTWNEREKAVYETGVHTCNDRYHYFTLGPERIVREGDVCDCGRFVAPRTVTIDESSVRYLAVP